MSDPTHQNANQGGPGSRKVPRIPRSPVGPADVSAVPPADPPADPLIRSLCEDDGRALDALLEARASGADRGPVPAGLGERADRVHALLSILDRDTFDSPAADLTVRTMQAIRARQQRQRFTEQVQMLAGPRRSLDVDWRQLATAAAVFILGAALLMPVMERQQADSRRIAGAGRLAEAGRAFASYAADNRGQMPRGEVRPGSVWWGVGQPESVSGRYVSSNSAHLYRLINKGYTNAVTLTCPENAFANNDALTPQHNDWTGPKAVSFSYQNQYRPQMLRLEEAPTMAVLADRNPLFDARGDRIVFNELIPLTAPSRAHRGAGQNVLTADGNVTWKVRPTVGLFGDDQEDNIWAANGISFYNGTELPSDALDSFLVP